jgi:AcrR family transcriptional regulator
VFSEKGFHESTVRDIGRAARLTEGAIYNYVRGKEDILFLVCDPSGHQISGQRASRARLQYGDAIERLSVALRGIAT